MKDKLDLGTLILGDVVALEGITGAKYTAYVCDASIPAFICRDDQEENKIIAWRRIEHGGKFLFRVTELLWSPLKDYQLRPQPSLGSYGKASIRHQRVPRQGDTIINPWGHRYIVSVAIYHTNKQSERILNFLATPSEILDSVIVQFETDNNESDVKSYKDIWEFII